jgi:acetyltransferase-like isoleucine patch superfamily enzyme
MKDAGKIVGEVPVWSIPRNADERTLARRYHKAVARAKIAGAKFKAGPSLLIGKNVELSVVGAAAILSEPARGPIQKEDVFHFDAPLFASIGLMPHWRMQNPPHFSPTRVLLHDGARLTLGQNSFIGPGAYLTVARNAAVRLGVSSYIGHGCTVNCMASIDIGAGVLIGQQVSIMDYDGHPVMRPDGRPLGDTFGGSKAPIKIEDNVWLGFRSIILKGVTIGRGAIIGAGAVVSSDIPPFCAAAGNPAKIIRKGVTWRRF